MTVLHLPSLVDSRAVSMLLGGRVGAGHFVSDDVRRSAARLVSIPLAPDPEWIEQTIDLLAMQRDRVAALADVERVSPSAVIAGGKWVATARGVASRLARFARSGSGDWCEIAWNAETALMWGVAINSAPHDTQGDWSLAHQAECVRRRLSDLGLHSDAAIVALSADWVSFLAGAPSSGCHMSEFGISVVAHQSVEPLSMPVSATIAHELIHSACPPARRNRSPHLIAVEHSLDEAVTEALTQRVVAMNTHGFLPEQSGGSDGAYGWAVRVVESLAPMLALPEEERTGWLAALAAQGRGARCAWIAERIPGATERGVADALHPLFLSPLS